MMFDIELWWVIGTLAVIAKSSHQSWQKLLTEEFSSINMSQVALLSSSVLFLVSSLVLRPELPSKTEVSLAGLSGVCIGLGFLSFVRAMETTDLSVVSPLQQTIPVFASVLEPIVLSELGYSIEIVLAAVLTTVGAYLVVMKPGDLLLPLKRLTDKGPILAVLTAFLYGVASIISHYTTQTMPVPYYLLIEVSVGFVVLTILRRSLPKLHPKLAIYGCMYSLNLGLSILTLSLVVASKATVFFRLSLVINVFVGIFLMGEENIVVRIIGSLVILSGVILTVI